MAGGKRRAVGKILSVEFLFSTNHVALVLPFLESHVSVNISPLFLKLSRTVKDLRFDFTQPTKHFAFLGGGGGGGAKYGPKWIPRK